jgi:hypothetical protein
MFYRLAATVQTADGLDPPIKPIIFSSFTVFRYLNGKHMDAGDLIPTGSTVVARSITLW